MFYVRRVNQKVQMDELGRLSPEDFRGVKKLPLILILDNIRSGLNVGSLFRSADAFRIQKIYCCGFSPVPPHREVLKTALGATETIEWEFAQEATEVVASLKSVGIHCLAIEQTQNSIDLISFLPEKDKTLALVLGNEVQGVQQAVIDACHGTLEIAQHGTKHSLNVAVCGGIVLFDLSNKLSSNDF